MKPADPLGGLLPPAPPGRDLPHHARHRGDLLAVVASEHTGERRWPVAAWLAPLGAALAVLVIVAGVFVLPGLLGRTPHGGGSTPAASGPPAVGGQQHATLIRRTQSYPVIPAVGALVLNGSIGDVAITGADRGTISITAHLEYRGGAPVIAHQVIGRKLELGYTCPPRSGDCGVSFDLTVPRGIGAFVRLSVGDIRLTGLSGVISARTGIGQIQASGMSGELALHTGTGMISAGFTVPPRLVYAHAGTGSVAIRVPSGTAYKVTASTPVGSVRITVPQAAGSSHVIQAITGTGTVTVTGS